LARAVCLEDTRARSEGSGSDRQRWGWRWREDWEAPLPMKSLT
jgi:hypothetical protein